MLQSFFKPLGEDWSAYAGIHDLKTEATLEQHRRLIEFARLVSSATDPEFAARVGGFLDLDDFARFLAAVVHEPIAANSAFRLNKFEQTVGLPGRDFFGGLLALPSEGGSPRKNGLALWL
jgi:hypothetical protein